MNIDYPFHFDLRGHTAAIDEANHVRNLIEQYLFTRPGERVNRPDFGAGLFNVVMEPNSINNAVALETTISAGLQFWLGTRIDLRAVSVLAENERLSVTLSYALRRTGQLIEDENFIFSTE